MGRWEHFAYLSIITYLTVVGCNDELDFPNGFKFGSATSAYQIEGAWNSSDKSPSIWDTLTHSRESVVVDGSSGDVACDSYRLWRDDVRIAKEMGLHFYRFSISWSRLLPTGFPNVVSEDGARYYNDLINELLANGIEPVVTLYHWDLPQRLQNLGGWTNPLIADWFSAYARVAFNLYADRVHTWITINEPLIICGVGYSSGAFAPRITEPKYGYYLCNKHILVAHAKAYRIYEREFKRKYHGKVGYANHVIWLEPSSPQHEELTELVRQHQIGMFSHPVFSREGGWPPAVTSHMATLSARQGYTTSRLPTFTDDEIDLVKGAADFYALQHYTSRLVKPTDPGDTTGPTDPANILGPTVSADIAWPMWGSPEHNATFYTDPSWKRTTCSWFYIYPEGLRRTLVWLKQQYGSPDILITENGYASEDPTLEDTDRIDYYNKYLTQVLLAMREDGVKVVGYTAWSLMDNFEWADGYRAKLGLYAVDFESENKTRTPRSSAKFYAKVIKHHSLDVQRYTEEHKNELR